MTTRQGGTGPPTNGRRSPSNSHDDRQRTTGAPGRLPARWWLWFVLLLLANFVVVSYLFPGPEAPVEVPYSFFKAQVQAGNVEQISTRGDAVEGTFEKPVTYHPKEDGATTRFTTAIPSFANTPLEEELVNKGVEIKSEPLEQPRSLWQSLLFSFGPALLIIGLFVWLSRRAAGQGGGLGGALTGLGRSRARRYDQKEEERVTFDDVAGIEEAENELVEIVDFLKQPERYTRLGGAAPKGVLLVGPPGTGKTLLARAVAGEAGVPFFSMSASEFVEMIVGVGASRVRDLFRQAREAAPAIVFIDELDSIGRARGRSALGGSSEQEQTLNQILTEMDGFSSREGVIVLAATNQPDLLDPALLRPGRFDRRVVVQPPDRRGREEILRVHTRSVPLASDVDLAEIAAVTPGLVGADLRNLVNEAALLAARRDRDEVHQRDFLDALEKIVLGPERQLVMSPEDRMRIAYHEGGHALLGLLVPGADPVNRVTIIPRGQALGVTYQRPEEDRYNYPEAYLRARIVGVLGGRSAEEIVYGTRTTGAENDIDQATGLARKMVTRWGMSDELDMVALAPPERAFLDGVSPDGARAYSEETAREIDAEVRGIIKESHEKARRLLTEHRRKLDALARALLEHETLDEQEILAITGLTRSPRPEDAGQQIPKATSDGRIDEIEGDHARKIRDTRGS